MKEINEESQFSRLSKPLPNEAFHTFSKEETGYEYDTTGHNYQYVINRLNEVLGIGKWRISEENISVSGSEVTKKVIIQLGEWTEQTIERRQNIPSVDDEIVIDVKVVPYFKVTAEVWNYGSGNSKVLGDAHKAALTNGLKKAAAMLGIGKETYEVSLDQDFIESLKVENKVSESSVDKLKEWKKKIENTVSIKNLEKIKDIVQNDRTIKSDVKEQLQKIYHNKLVKLKSYEQSRTTKSKSEESSSSTGEKGN